MFCPDTNTPFRRESISHQLRVLSNMTNRRAEAMIHTALNREVTQMQGQVIGYLCIHKDHDVFQHNIEAVFSISRSTASKMLTLMEDNGLITRTGVARDARLKKIVPTEKSVRLFHQITQGMEQFEQLLRTGLTEEEVTELLRLLRKVQKNVE